MSEKKKEDKLGLVVGTDDAVLWKEVAESAKNIIEKLEKDLKVNKAIYELALSKCQTETILKA